MFNVWRVALATCMLSAGAQIRLIQKHGKYSNKMWQANWIIYHISTQTEIKNIIRMASEFQTNLKEQYKKIKSQRLNKNLSWTLTQHLAWYLEVDFLTQIPMADASILPEIHGSMHNTEPWYIQFTRNYWKHEQGDGEICWSKHINALQEDT